MIKKLTVFSVLICFIISCQQESKKEKEISKIDVSFKVERFDKKFAEAQPEDIQQLKSEYPLLFPEEYSDQHWVKLLSDTLQNELEEEVLKTFPDSHKLEEELEVLFQHLTYYFTDFKIPQIITVISQVDHENKVILTDDKLLISLDTYLGKDHYFYEGVQRFFSQNYTPEQILPDIAEQYAEKYVPKPKRTLIEQMIYHGKILYFKEQMLPNKSRAEIMGYEEAEMDWADSNEKQIWGFFVESELLYDTDTDLRKRFFDVGPFTSFGLELDNESPSKLGQYTGWQIVKQYAEKYKDVSFTEILQMDNETLFKESNYKPKQK